MSDSEGMDLEIDVSEGVPDDSICPVCKRSTYIGETISCETCMYWFHFECVGVNHDDECVKSEDIPYFCPKCSGNPAKFNFPSKSGKKAPVNKKGKKKETKSVKEPQTPKSSKKSTKNVPEPAQQVNPIVKSPPIKLKISFTKQQQQQQPSVESSSSPITSSSGENSRRKKNENDSEDEEEKWLDAVESGNLHAVDDELKRIRDPKLMTARQRAMITKKSDLIQTSPGAALPSPVLPTDIFSNAPVNLDESGHISLDFGGKKKVISEEIQQEQRAIKSQKRKELELVKREEDKKKTMDRLLLKKDSKAAKLIKATSKRQAGHNVPKWTYKINADGPTLSVPVGADYPVNPTKISTPPPTIKCSVSECPNSKRYNCSKTGKPICSLACYNKNLASICV